MSSDPLKTREGNLPVPDPSPDIRAAAHAVQSVAEMITRLKGVWEVIPDALASTASALEQVDQGASERIQVLEAELTAYRKLGELWDGARRACSAYGGVSNMEDTIRRYPVKPKVAAMLGEEIDQRVAAWVAENPGAELLAPAVRQAVVSALLRRFGAERLDRIACLHVKDAVAWVREYTIPSVAERGPLALELARARVRRGISSEEAAKILGVHRSTYSRWEQGRCAPAAVHVPELAFYLELPDQEVDTLLDAQAAYCSPVYPGEGREKNKPEVPEAAPDFRALRLAAGYSARQAARLAGVAKSVVLRADKGRAIKPASAAKLLALYSGAGTREARAPYAAGTEIQAAL